MITRLKLSTIEQGLPKYRSMLAGNDAYKPSSFESIATVTASSSVSSLTFSSIPSTYTSLQIRGILRGAYASGYSENMYIRINSDTGFNYNSHGLEGDGSSASAPGAATGSAISATSQGTIAALAPADLYSGYIIDLHDYTSTTRNKTVRIFSGWDSNQYGRVGLSSGLWRNTNAITSVTILCGNGNIAAGSTFALYGVKGA
jgi:hypothetical protein